MVSREDVIEALKKNEEFKYSLVTSLDDIPAGSALDLEQKRLK